MKGGKRKAMNKGLGVVESTVVPLRAGVVHAVELCVGDGAWSRKEFSQAEAAHQYMAGAVAGAARPSTGGWINGRVRFRLLEGERIEVEIAIEVTYPGAKT